MKTVTGGFGKSMGTLGVDTRGPDFGPKSVRGADDPTRGLGFTFTSFDFPKGDEHRRTVDQEHMETLQRRPAHKGFAVKFRNPNGSVENSYERQISPLTMEDKFSKFDMPWISNLRREDPDAPVMLNGLKSENK